MFRPKKKQRRDKDSKQELEEIKKDNIEAGKRQKLRRKFRRRGSITQSLLRRS
ncbi:MAG: hypothetical protein WAM14_06920 [Candidatus Nitrosopolaris sp.]